MLAIKIEQGELKIKKVAKTISLGAPTPADKRSIRIGQLANEDGTTTHQPPKFREYKKE